MRDGAGGGAVGTLMVMSTLATRRIEEMADAATGPLWFQLYVYSDRRVSEALVRRAEAAGFTSAGADGGYAATRHARARCAQWLRPAAPSAYGELRRSLGCATIMPRCPAHRGLECGQRLFDQSLTWDALAWLKSITALPIVVKGILTAEDAPLAVEHGADGIIVSNHGGRQLDGVLATIEALPEVVDAVAGRCEVYLDGGVRRGTDVLKALALGARGVFWAVPCYGGWRWMARQEWSVC